MFGGGKALDEVRPQFGEQNQRGVDLHAGDLSQVHAAEPVQFRSRVELRFVALRFATCRSGGCLAGSSSHHTARVVGRIKW